METSGCKITSTDAAPWLGRIVDSFLLLERCDENETDDHDAEYSREYREALEC